ncbi:hypothetical protein TRVL_05107 [Trypanosoma vivax]|nr:hypothetical protein TRVL_05107 [Trypanosoma vivax]
MASALKHSFGHLKCQCVQVRSFSLEVRPVRLLNSRSTAFMKQRHPSGNRRSGRKIGRLVLHRFVGTNSTFAARNDAEGAIAQHGNLAKRSGGLSTKWQSGFRPNFTRVP